MTSLSVLIAQYWQDIGAYERALASAESDREEIQLIAKHGYQRTLAEIAVTPARGLDDVIAAVDWLGRYEYTTASSHEAVVNAVIAYLLILKKVN
jgi:hypothetical protein